MHVDVGLCSPIRIRSRLLLPLLLAVIMVWPMSAFARKSLDLVDNVDLTRYEGLWYQIALLPNRFQDQCVANTSAEYTLKNDGRIKVVNRCQTRDGSVEEVIGEARRPDSDRPAVLEVRFAPNWLSWLPFVWGDYQIMALDEDYRWVMVGAPSREFLWILARQPALQDAQLDALLGEAKAQGFDIDEIQMSPQDQI